MQTASYEEMKRKVKDLEAKLLQKNDKGKDLIYLVIQNTLKAKESQVDRYMQTIQMLQQIVVNILGQNTQSHQIKTKQSLYYGLDN